MSQRPLARMLVLLVSLHRLSIYGGSHWRPGRSESVVIPGDIVLGGITIGVHILDTCGRDTYALNQSLHFVRASLSNLDMSVLECADRSAPRVKKTASAGPIFGVIGGSYSSVSLQVANLLRLFHIPQISPASTAKALSDKTRFDYFARTVPPDTFQSIALVDVVKSANWSYVSTVYSEGSYGEYGIEVFTREATERNVCIAAAVKVPSAADDRMFDDIIQRLSKKANARARRWGRQIKLVEGLEEEAEGAITVELQSENIPGFDDYMASLTPDTNRRNPWFSEYWEEVFDCLLKKERKGPIQTTLNATTLFCPPNLRLTSERGYEQESKVQFVVDAVYAFALALHNLQRDVCSKLEGLCPSMANYDRGVFYRNYLLNVSFTGKNFVVGKWFNSLDIRTEELVWARGTKDIPISACSLPCEPGMIKKQQGDTCCWVCDQCEEYEYVHDEYTCMDCGPGKWPHEDKRGCYQLAINHIRWNSAFAIAPAVISCLGIVATMAVACLLFHHRDTPVVRASGRELTIILLAGVLVCYLNTFLLLATPTTVTCILQRFGVGVSFSAVYGALLTKTNRIARIFDSASRTAVRPRYISPASQVCIAAALIALQIVLTLVWMIIEPPGTRFFYPDRKQVILKCNIQDMSFLFSQLYNALLILISTVYAVKTRKIPENFNESKFIGFTMYTTCIIWLAFVPIYFGTGNAHETQITTLCVAISLSATVTLVCLYSPKIYIILFQPDKNIRRKVTMGDKSKKQGSSAGTSSITKYTGCELTSESMPLQSALTAAVQTSVGVTEISLASNASSKTNNEQVAQL
ncbi:Metabotropic glutamate receptor [Apis cerana cerana]|uniref:Metabotropic glutamate receptor n=1 Tax=Apis cerana cerana TaxID=94128 RepID=A0A2A3ELW8_APICC|nr:Metabotropic glutamate receptor [Apis cerana cerana]